MREATSWQMPDAAALVHVQPQAIAWRSPHPDKLQVVTSTARGLVPGGYCVSPTRFRELSRNPERVLELPQVPRISLRMPPAGRIDAGALAHWQSIFAEPWQVGVPRTIDCGRLSRELAQAILCGYGIGEVLDQLIGVGEGDKPIGDQVTIGVLAGLQARRHDISAAAPFLRERLGRTTLSARHDLAWAMDGEFTERIHMLVLSLHSPAAARAQARRAAGWRGSSGLELANGVMAGIEAPGIPSSARSQPRA